MKFSPVLGFCVFFFLLNVQMILSAAYVVSPVDFIPEGVSYDLYFHLVNLSW